MSKSDLTILIRNLLAHFHEAQQNLPPGDFTSYKIAIKDVRYIGGFGEMFWLQF